MRTHEAANALPEMTDSEFSDLVEDISKHGLLLEIELFGGKIIDGRHRYKACKKAGVEPRYVEVDLGDQSPAQYVWSLNGMRRHLTPSQKAFVALAFMPQCTEDAKERQKLSKGRGKKGPAKIPDLNGDARDVAAEMVGVSPRYVTDAEAIKKHSPELAEQVKKGERTISQAKTQVKKEKKEAESKKAASAARRAIKTGDHHNIHHGDAFELSAKIPDNSCPLIFTDPPYHRHCLELFEKLAGLADRVLIDGGSLVTFCGQIELPTVMDALRFGELRYFWTLCCFHTGPTLQMNEYGIKNQWKPMLWFVKGKFRRDPTKWLNDRIESTHEKSHHEWQQSEVEATECIENLTVPGDLVVDPFCGSGTTSVVARRLKRQWWTADTDEKAVATARKRIDQN